MDTVQRNKLVTENIGMAYYWARKSSLPEDDASQIACIALLSAAEAWDPDRGPFGVIAAYYCRRNLSSACLEKTIKQPYSKSLRTEFKFDSLDAPTKEDGSLLHELIPGRGGPDQETKLFWNEVSELLTETELKVCRKIANGDKLTEIAADLNLTRQQITLIRKRAFEKLRAVL